MWKKVTIFSKKAITRGYKGLIIPFSQGASHLGSHTIFTFAVNAAICFPSGCQNKRKFLFLFHRWIRVPCCSESNSEVRRLSRRQNVGIIQSYDGQIHWKSRYNFLSGLVQYQYDVLRIPCTEPHPKDISTAESRRRLNFHYRCPIVITDAISANQIVRYSYTRKGAWNCAFVWPIAVQDIWSIGIRKPHLTTSLQRPAKSSWQHHVSMSSQVGFVRGWTQDFQKKWKKWNEVYEILEQKNFLSEKCGALPPLSWKD